MNVEKLYFVNAKWKDTLLIRVLQDSLQRATGYLLGGDTFFVDTVAKMKLYKYPVYNSTINAFIHLFSDTSAEILIHKTPVNSSEMDVLMCEDALMNDGRMWFLRDTTNDFFSLYKQEINLDTDRYPETVIEIDRSYYGEHTYRIYDDQLQGNVFLYEYSSRNKFTGAFPIQKEDQSNYWSITHLFNGFGESHHNKVLFRLRNGIITQESEEIPKLSHVLYNRLLGDGVASAFYTTTLSETDNSSDLEITFNYSFEIQTGDTSYSILNGAIYKTTIHRPNNQSLLSVRYPNNFPPTTTDITPVFIDQLDYLRLHGTADQRKQLRNFKKQEWELQEQE